VSNQTRSPHFTRTPLLFTYQFRYRLSCHLFLTLFGPRHILSRIGHATASICPTDRVRFSISRSQASGLDYECKTSTSAIILHASYGGMVGLVGYPPAPFLWATNISSSRCTSYPVVLHVGLDSWMCGLSCDYISALTWGQCMSCRKLQCSVSTINAQKALDQSNMATVLTFTAQLLNRNFDLTIY
jgi:hypothetical protein